MDENQKEIMSCVSLGEDNVGLIEGSAQDDNMEDNFVSNLLGNYFERFTSLVNNSHNSFLEHSQRIQAIKADVAQLDANISTHRRNLKKRMQNAVEMTELLSNKIRRIAQTSANNDSDEDVDDDLDNSPNMSKVQENDNSISVL